MERQDKRRSEKINAMNVNTPMTIASICTAIVAIALYFQIRKDVVMLSDSRHEEINKHRLTEYKLQESRTREKQLLKVINNYEDSLVLNRYDWWKLGYACAWYRKQDGVKFRGQFEKDSIWFKKHYSK